MRTIHKYRLPYTGTVHHVPTHEGARFLHVAEQASIISVWAEVDTDAPERTRTLHIVGTGNAVPDAATEYVGTALTVGGVFVFHVYAETEA